MLSPHGNSGRIKGQFNYLEEPTYILKILLHIKGTREVFAGASRDHSIVSSLLQTRH